MIMQVGCSSQSVDKGNFLPRKRKPPAWSGHASLFKIAGLSKLICTKHNCDDHSLLDYLICTKFFTWSIILFLDYFHYFSTGAEASIIIAAPSADFPIQKIIVYRAFVKDNLIDI